MYVMIVSLRSRFVEERCGSSLVENDRSTRTEKKER